VTSETRKRSIAKAVTWRITASLISAVIVYIIVGELTIAAAVGGIDIVVKMLFYYGHERLWNRLSFGIKKTTVPGVKRGDFVGIGEELDPYEFFVSKELNQHYVEAVDDPHPRYAGIVHPALLMYFSNCPRSPSFYLPPNMATIMAKDHVRFLNDAPVDRVYRVQWKVVDVYHKRGRQYQVKEALVSNQDGAVIMERTITDTYVNGKVG